MLCLSSRWLQQRAVHKIVFRALYDHAIMRVGIIENIWHASYASVRAGLVKCHCPIGSALGL